MDDDEFDIDEQTAIVQVQVPQAPAKATSRPYFIVIAGPAVGEMHPLDDGELVIGRAAGCQIRVNDQGVSRRHARIVVDGEHVRIADLGSVNGTLVNGDVVTESILNDGDKIRIGSTTILRFAYHDAHDEAFQRNLLEGVRRDGLTKAFRKGYFFERLEREIAFARRHGTPLTVLMLDADHFKAINDDFGHPAGDAVLTELARRLMSVTRSEDIVARYGGEEFAIACRGISAEQGARLAQRLLVAVRSRPFAGIDRPVTISIGIAEYQHGQTPEELIDAADRLLYQAKRRGRDRAVH